MPGQDLLSAPTSCVPHTATRGNRRRTLAVAQQPTEARLGELGGVNITMVLLSMLLRYVSEWDPSKGKHTKGGYLSGQISGVPDTATKMVLSFVTESMEDSPLLLHVVRMSTKGGRTLRGKITSVINRRLL